MGSYQTNDLNVDKMPSVNDEDNDKLSAVKLRKKLRMTERADKKDWILYPEDTTKTYWDIFITLILLITCLLTPWRIAFGEETDPIEWQIISYTIDLLFLIDIVVIFFSAYYDGEFAIVENHK